MKPRYEDYDGNEVPIEQARVMRDAGEEAMTKLPRDPSQRAKAIVDAATRGRRQRTISYDDFTSHLAEGFHTAFRKGSDHPKSAEIWRAIRALPPEEWGNIIDWVAMGITDGKALTIAKKP